MKAARSLNGAPAQMSSISVLSLRSCAAGRFGFSTSVSLPAKPTYSSLRWKYMWYGVLSPL